MNGEWARIHVTHRVDQAHYPPGSAHVQAGQSPRLAERRQVEEGIAGEHPLSFGNQPVVKLHLLVGGGVQVGPYVSPAPGRSQPGYPQRRSVTACQRGEFVELGDVAPGDHNRDLDAAKSRRCQVLQRAHRHVERPGAADGVVDLGRGAVE
ncbi:Uncharacterised protein [Mycobacterium tuberculosis]|nr:Uncharacterised protein [Mycobacterium tuberculosis]COX20719.1 Uncharacterised protein [Mycobacterium tuberculosis]